MVLQDTRNLKIQCFHMKNNNLHFIREYHIALRLTIPSLMPQLYELASIFCLTIGLLFKEAILIKNLLFIEKILLETFYL